MIAADPKKELADDLQRVVLGLDNVRIELPLAGIGSRVLAATIDYLLLFCVQMLWLVGGALGLTWLGLDFGWMAALLALGGFFVQWGYFALLEIRMNGQTPGKLAVGLRVVSADGTRAGNMALLIRNLFRSLDILIGVPLMAVHRESRRLGDLIAATVVIRQYRERRPRIGRYPRTWAPTEIAVAESFLARLPLMEKRLAERLAKQLLTHLESLEPDFFDPDEKQHESADSVDRLSHALAVTHGEG